MKKCGRQAVHNHALCLKRIQNTQLSRVREDANAFIEVYLRQWLLDGRKAFLSSSGVANMFEPIDRVYFCNIQTNFCHGERPRKATVLDVATDLVIYCTNSRVDRDIWLMAPNRKGNNGLISYITKYWIKVPPLKFDASSHHPTTRSASSSIPT